MKKLYILLLFMVCAGYAQQQPFITTWEIPANSQFVSMNTQGENFTVNFGDGYILTNQNSTVSHTYNAPGLYTITISGNLHSIKFPLQAQKLKTIEQWGDIAWTTMESAFQGCTQMTLNATDTPDLSQVTNMSSMFWHCHLFNTNINNWDVSNVTNASEVFSYCYVFNQPLNSWDVSNVTNMDGVFRGCNSFNQPLDGWDVSNVTNMENMFTGAGTFNQPLNNWDVSNVTTLYNIFNSANSFNQPLNNWDVSNVTNMWSVFSFNTSFNQPLDQWDVSNVTNMLGIFTEASAFNQDISSWDFSSVEGYIGINKSGLDIDNYDALLNRFAQLGLQNIILSAHELEYCNIGAYNYLIEELGWTIQFGSLAEQCTGNNVTGTMLIDENLNGCDASDTPAVNFMVQATNGTYNYGTFVNATGNYDLRVQEDTYTVSPVNVPDYFTVTPESSEITFTGFGNSEALNFCLMPNQNVQDLNVTVLPIGDARPGFESEYKILIENIGTQSITNATVTLTFDNTLQSFVSAVPAPAATTANQLTFNVGNLGVFETKTINLTMTTFVPPVVNGGEVATFTANVTPDAGDNTPDDNTFTLNQTIVNSYDPNDKRVVQGDEIYMEQTGDYLDYIIRFQNTGTASAITVRVEDTLSHNLDWATLKPIAASHAYRVEVTQGNKVNFIFDNINLPHEAADAEGSNGYIAYKVKPKQGIQLGDVIAGNAGIYFDFNLPIITNTVTTTVVEPLGVKQNAKTAVSIYPNPAGDVMHLQAQAGTQVQQVSIYNLQGSQLMSVSQNTETLNISSLGAGVYLLQVQTNTGRATCRLVKK